MPKPIKLTQEWIQQMIQEFTAALGDLKLSDGKVSYTKSLTYGKKDGPKAEVYFETIAYAKMLTLLHSFSDEVAWHGIVERRDKGVFVIKDIIVYPQEVTGGTVTTDQERYQTWLMQLDDEVFNGLHMQGHSHVNFATTPSAVDTKFYDSILEQLGDDDFYIFMIFNKRLERTVKIYDLANNILYENGDVEIGLMCEDGDLDQFLADAQQLVVKKATTTYATSAGANVTVFPKEGKKNEVASPVSSQSKAKQSPGYYGGYGSGYGGYGSGYGGYGGKAIDYDEEIFGKRGLTGAQRADWWND